MSKNPQQGERARISWTDEERRKVAAEAYRLIQKDDALSSVRAVDRAQKSVLAKERQRPMGTQTSYKVNLWLTPLFAEMRSELKATAKEGINALFDAPGIDMDKGTAAAVMPTGDAPSENAPVEEADDARPSSTEVVRLNAAQEAAHAAQFARVHWNDAERKQIAIRAYATMKRWPDMKKIDAFRKAQESEMPLSRQRHIQGWSVIAEWAEPLLELFGVEEQIALHREQEERQAREAQEREERELAEREAARVAAIEAERAQNEAIDAAVKQRLAAMPVEHLIRAFAARIAQETIAAMGAEFQAALMGGIVNAAQQFAHKEEVRPATDDKIIVPPKSRLPRVMVCGLMRQQEDDAEKAFLGAVEFVFVKSSKTGGNGEGAHAVQSRGGDVDVIFSMVDYSGHDIDRAAKKLGVPFVPITGSVSALKRTVREWIDGKIALKAAA
jgi:hypothetical protein